jgi:hypothetical protein
LVNIIYPDQEQTTNFTLETFSLLNDIFNVGDHSGCAVSGKKYLFLIHQWDCGFKSHCLYPVFVFCIGSGLGAS